MDLDKWIDDVVDDVMALSDMCDRRGLILMERAFHDRIATLQAERQRRSATPVRSDAGHTRSNVVAFVPRGAQATITGTFLPVLGAADGIAWFHRAGCGPVRPRARGSDLSGPLR